MHHERQYIIRQIYSNIAYAFETECDSIRKMKITNIAK